VETVVLYVQDQLYSLPSESQIPESEFRARVDDVRTRMRDENVDALVLYGTFHSPAYLMYITNYWPFDTGGAVTLGLDEEPTLLVSDNKKQPRDVSWVEEIEHIGYRDLSLRKISGHIAEQIRALDDVSRVGLVGQSTVSNQLPGHLDEHLESVELVEASSIVNRSMQIKSEREIELLREAARITDEVLQSTLEKDLVGMTEYEIASHIDAQWSEYDAIPFYRTQQMITTGPVGGPNGNQWVTDREVGEDDILTLDSHCIYSGYWSDTARSIAMEEAPPQRVELVDLSRDTVDYTIDQVEPGVAAGEIHQKAETYLTDRNDEIDYRIIPHPVGLPFIGNPWLAPDQPTGGENVSPDAMFELEPNMVYSITCEVSRSEDRAFFESVVRVTETGVETLTDLPLNLEYERR